MATVSLFWDTNVHLGYVQMDATTLNNMLGVVSQQCCVRLHGAKSMTDFKLCATTRDNMQQDVQTDATCNIQQCCVRLHAALDDISSWKCS